MGVLFFIGCWPCCLIPLCTDDCKQNVHNCTGCGRVVSINNQVINLKFTSKIKTKLNKFKKEIQKIIKN